jgi:predicted secreted Zn-dependent protease
MHKFFRSKFNRVLVVLFAVLLFFGFAFVVINRVNYAVKAEVATTVAKPSPTPSPTPPAKVSSSVTPSPKTTQTVVFGPQKSVPKCSKISGTEADSPDVSSNSPGFFDNSKYNYYQIYGTTENELYDQASQCGPDTADGVFQASTSYRIRWTYRYTTISDSDNCQISSVAVGVNIKINFPKWDPPSGESQDVIDFWNDKTSHLKDHEEHHRQIALDGARQILTTLQNFPQGNCSDFVSNTESAANSIFSQIEQQQKDLDSTTNHGTD